MPLDHRVPENLTEQILGCTKCPLGKKTTPISHIGSLNNEIMIIGEAPGEHEEKYKEPFVGRSGKLLNSMLDSAGIDRSDCFITNVVKCRPIKIINDKKYNRTPILEEINICSPYLKKQIKIIQPKLIITLGKISFNFVRPILRIFLPFNTSQGKIYRKKDLTFIILPLYHPAYILRNYTYKKQYQSSFIQLKPIIKELAIKTSRIKGEIAKWL